MNVCIGMPTYNRADRIERAVESSLGQDYPHANVLVIDDGSTDTTEKVLEPFFDNPRFCYVKLKHNTGAAHAKNLAIMLGSYDALTFHDSDDIYLPEKVDLQVRALRAFSNINDPDTNWNMGKTQEHDIVLVQHTFVRLDGKTYRVGKAISLVDDFFPDLQNSTDRSGSFLLPNPGLYRKKVFEKIGGFKNTIEEDRDFRNRTIISGFRYCLIEKPLIIKREEYDALTIAENTGMHSPLRQRTRRAIRRKLFNTPSLSKINLEHVRIEFVSNPDLLTLNKSIPATNKTLQVLSHARTAV